MLEVFLKVIYTLQINSLYNYLQETCLHFKKELPQVSTKQKGIKNCSIG